MEQVLIRVCKLQPTPEQCSKPENIENAVFGISLDLKHKLN